MISQNEFNLICDYSKGLAFANSDSERNRIISINPNLAKINYPLTKDFLIRYFNNTEYSNAKNTYNNPGCFADTYSYLILSYGKATGSGKDDQNTGSGSGGVLPWGFGNPFNINLPDWLKILLEILLTLWLLKKIND